MPRWFRPRIVSAILVIAGLAVAGGCGRGPAVEGNRGEAGSAGRAISQIGSTTLLPLAGKWREAYNKQHPDVEIAVSGGGSGTGIKALISGTADIANSSREIEPEEMRQAKAAGAEPVEHVVAHDGIAVIVNPANPLSRISIAELSAIFAGELKEWKAAGAPGLGRIQVVSRDSASGTYEAFKELVVEMGGKRGGRDYAASALKQTSNQAVLALVATTKSAIGYVGLGYLDKSVKVLAVTSSPDGAAVEPAVETVMAGAYPISRALYCYTNGEPTGALKSYIDWIKGPPGQAIVKELGFVPVKEE